MPHPIIRRRQHIRTRHTTRHRRHHRNPRNPERQTRHHPTKLIQHRLHQRRMKRMTHHQTLRPKTPTGQHTGNRQHLILITRQNHRRRTINSSNTHPLRKQRQHHRLRSTHRHHRTTHRQRLHQPPTRRHQNHRIIQRQHPRHMSSSNLPHRMPHQKIRHHTPRSHQTEQRHLNRKQRRLRHTRPIKPRTRKHRLPQRHPPPTISRPTKTHLIKPPTHLIKSLRKNRKLPIQLRTHPRPLRPLTSEQKAHPTRNHRRHRRPRRPRRHTSQTSQQLRPIPAHHHRTVIENRTGRRQRQPHIRRVPFALTRQMRTQPVRLSGQSTGRPTRKNPGRDRGLNGCPRLFGGPCRRLRHHDMAVGAAHTERAHPCDQLLVGCGPLPYSCCTAQAQLVQRNVRVRRAVVQARREPSVPDGSERPSGDPAMPAAPSRWPMLVFTDPTAGVLPVRRCRQPRPERRPRSGHRPGPGTVQLDVLHRAGVDPACSRTPAGAPRLGLLVRRGHARSAAVVDGAAAHHAVDPVPVGERAGERLEHDGTATLTPDVAVGAGVEGVAAAVRGQATHFVEITDVSGSRLRLTPPTIAASDSPRRRLSHARCTATSEEDCPVSTVRLGPAAPRKYDSRLAIMPRCTPGMVCWVLLATASR